MLTLLYQSQPSGTESQPQTSQNDALNKAPASKKSKKTVNYIDLPIDEQTYSLSKREMDAAFEKEVCVFVCVVCK